MTRGEMTARIADLEAALDSMYSKPDQGEAITRYLSHESMLSVQEELDATTHNTDSKKLQSEVVTPNDTKFPPSFSQLRILYTACLYIDPDNT